MFADFKQFHVFRKVMVYFDAVLNIEYVSELLCHAQLSKIVRHGQIFILFFFISELVSLMVNTCKAMPEFFVIKESESKPRIHEIVSIINAFSTVYFILRNSIFYLNTAFDP